MENQPILDKIRSYHHKSQRRGMFSWVSFNDNTTDDHFLHGLWALHRQRPSVQPQCRCWRSAMLSHATLNTCGLKQQGNCCSRNIFISIHVEIPWTVKSGQARFVVTSFSGVVLIPWCRGLRKWSVCSCCCSCCREQLARIWELGISRCAYRCCLGTC